jgi:hypothetical protein
MKSFRNLSKCLHNLGKWFRNIAKSFRKLEKSLRNIAKCLRNWGKPPAKAQNAPELQPGRAALLKIRQRSGRISTSAAPRHDLTCFAR